ncbi:hypothetical protein FRC05_007190 [Tulasnella sp. 425]|nr:hypothetical protein FRC05_007190 [Tulasnella sp. 425]
MAQDPLQLTTIRQSISADGRAVPLPSLFQPMEMIPVEILVEILVYCLPPLFDSQTRQRTTLALVCRRWNTVVEETPILWSSITNEDTPSQVERSLARSNKHPIDVIGYWTTDGLFYEEDTLAEIRSFFELVHCHMGRWRHVSLELVSDIPLGRTGGSAPLLESLEVGCGADSPAVGELVTLFPGVWMPRLREVSIWGLEPVQLDMPFPPTLTKLSITNLKYWTTSFSKLITILISCPGLTALELSSICDYSIEDEGWKTLPVVSLPALRELTLRKLAKQVLRAILQRLQFPSECVVWLSSRHFYTDPSANLTSTLAHHIDDLQNGGINQITIAIARFDFVLRAQGPRWHMEFELRTMGGAKDIVLLLNPERTTCAEGSPHDRIPVTLEFIQDVPVDRELDRLSSISDLECVTSLKVDMSLGTHLAILSHLATRITNKGAMPTWHLPGLRELHIKGAIATIDPVIEFVENRRGQGDRLGLPAPLQRIEFEGNQVEGEDLSPSGPSKQARPDTFLDLLNLWERGAQVIWYGERVH